MCNFVLASLLHQNDRLVWALVLFFSAPVEVPDISPQGFTGGGGEPNKRSDYSPSGVVPPSHEEDVMPPINVCVLRTVASLYKQGGAVSRSLCSLTSRLLR